MNDNGIWPGQPPGDPTDDALDDVLAASDASLLIAISGNLNLDVGLTQIIGEPPLREPSPVPSGSHTPPRRPKRRGHEVDAPCHGIAIRAGGNLSSQIALMRAQLLDLTREAPPRTATALIDAAASSLKELNRGLDARELTRHEASSLLTNADRALERAAITSGRTVSEYENTSTWKWIALLGLIIVVVPVIALSAGNDIVLIGVTVLQLSALAVAVTMMVRARRATCAAREHWASPLGSGVRKVRYIRAQLKRLRPEVMRLFDDADDFSTQGAPFV
jgi:hypothetical protein